MTMAFARKGAVIVAAGAAMCFLQGCFIPDVVRVPCDGALSPLLSAVAANETSYTRDQCLNTFKATQPQNGCIVLVQRFIHDAKAEVFRTYLDKCAAFVKTSVCEHDCETIAPSVISEKINAWAHASDFEKAMRTSVKAHISKLVVDQYDYKFFARQVPRAMAGTCKDLILLRLSREDMLPAQQHIFDICNSYTSDCSKNGYDNLKKVRQHEVDAFADRCGKAALDQLCPKHSKCAIDTSTADLSSGDDKVRVWIDINIDAWIASLKNKYMQAAQAVVPPSRLYTLTGRIFHSSSISNGVGLVLGAVFISAATAALVVFRRRRRNVPSSRCVSVEDSSLLEQEVSVEVSVEE